MSISARKLTKYFNEGGIRKNVLKGVDLDVRPGEIFVLTGANGAGKTTLLKILATLVLPDSGDIRICGNDAVVDPVPVRRSIGFVFEPERSFYQILSVEQNLRFFGSLYGLDRPSLEKRLEWSLKEFGLAAWRGVRFSHCSSGMRQKAAIARALLTDPPVLLIDELTRSLDEEAVKEVWEFVERAVTSGQKTCLLVTHDRQQAEKRGGRIGIIKDGIVKQ